jgi:hypothetical protein
MRRRQLIGVIGGRQRSWNLSERACERQEILRTAAGLTVTQRLEYFFLLQELVMTYETLRYEVEGSILLRVLG